MRFWTVWNTFTDNPVGYWYNDREDTLDILANKVGTAEIRKNVILDDIQLQEISSVGKNANTSAFIGGSYAYLVRRLIEKVGSMY